MRLSKAAAKKIVSCIKEQTKASNLVYPDRAVRLTAMTVLRIVLEDVRNVSIMEFHGRHGDYGNRKR